MILLLCSGLNHASLPKDIALSGKRVLANVATQGISRWDNPWLSGQTLNPKTSVCIGERLKEIWDVEEKIMWSPGQWMTFCSPQAKEYGKLPEAGRGREGFSPRASRVGSPANTVAVASRTKREWISGVLGPQVGVDLLEWPQEINILPHRIATRTERGHVHKVASTQ